MTTISVACDVPTASDRSHGDHDQRQREQGIDDPADRLVDDPAVVAGAEPDDRAAGDAEERRERRDLQRCSWRRRARARARHGRASPYRASVTRGMSEDRRGLRERIVGCQAASRRWPRTPTTPRSATPDDERLRPGQLRRASPGVRAATRLGRPNRCRTRRRRCSFSCSEADARVEHRVEDVGDEGRERGRRCRRSDTPLCSIVKSLFCAACRSAGRCR